MRYLCFFVASVSARNISEIHSRFPKSVPIISIRKDVYSHQRVRTGLFQSTGNTSKKLPFLTMRKNFQCAPHEPELDIESGKSSELASNDIKFDISSYLIRILWFLYRNFQFSTSSKRYKLFIGSNLCSTGNWLQCMEQLPFRREGIQEGIFQ